VFPESLWPIGAGDTSHPRLPTSFQEIRTTSAIRCRKILWTRCSPAWSRNGTQSVVARNIMFVWARRSAAVVHYNVPKPPRRSRCGPPTGTTIGGFLVSVTQVQAGCGVLFVRYATAS
jgi:hypothetical protein